MTSKQSSVDQLELDKFAQHAPQWWDMNGPLKTLHDINKVRVEFINQHCHLEGASLLDVGCGGGILSEALAQAGAKVTGIDATPEAIAAAKEHALLASLNIDYHTCPIEDFDHPQFDVITCMELLEHVPNPELVMEHCARLLKPQGILLVSTINRGLKAYLSVILAAEYVLRLLPRQTHDYQKFIKPSELSAMARKMDLELIDIKGLHYNPLTRDASLTSDSSANYLMAFARSC